MNVIVSLTSKLLLLGILLSTTGCGLVKINGKPLYLTSKDTKNTSNEIVTRQTPAGTSETEDGEKKTATGKKAKATTAKSSAIVLEEGISFSVPKNLPKNPLVIEGRPLFSDTFSMKMGMTGGHCAYWLTKSPVIVLDMKHEYKKLKLDVNGQAIGFRHDGGPLQCWNNRKLEDALDLSGMTGKVEIYVGKGHDKRPKGGWKISLENLDIPRTHPWPKNSRVLKIAKTYSNPYIIQIDHNYEEEEQRVFDTCGSTVFSAKPDFVFSLKRPLKKNVSLGAMSAHHLQMVIEGPLTKDHRNVPSRCFPGNRLSRDTRALLDLDVGQYGIFIASDDEQMANHVRASLIVDVPHKRGEGNIYLLRDRRISSNLSVRERNIHNHYPNLDPFLKFRAHFVSDFRKRIYVQELFQRVPKQLIVYVKEEVNAEEGGKLPGKGEPVLVTINSRGEIRILTMEGTIHSFDAEKLLTKVPKKIHWPKRIRDIAQVQMEDVEHMELAIKQSKNAKEKSIIKSFIVAAKIHDKCWDKLVEKFQPTSDRLRGQISRYNGFLVLTNQQFKNRSRLIDKLANHSGRLDALIAKQCTSPSDKATTKLTKQLLSVHHAMQISGFQTIKKAILSN